MHHIELWVTRPFNDHLAGLGNFFLGLVGMPPQHRPWANFVVMQFLVVVLLMVLFAALRRRLSVDRPGALQHAFEVVYQFIFSESQDAVGHNGPHYLAFFGTIFIYILACNLIGIVPGLESPTMVPPVPTGCAIATFVYYNLMGVQEQGIGKYLLNFAGPMPWLAPLMVPIELISHLARPLSLTIRLYANMYAGEAVTLVFLQLTYLVIPALFMGLHVFVSLLQAYIFMLLTMMYVGGAVTQEH
jgi:F-type H+-transporting ATPase subunit a